MTETYKQELLCELIEMLAQERKLSFTANKDATSDELFSTFRALVNTRPALVPAPELLKLQDKLLQGLLEERGSVNLDEALVSPQTPQLLLWKGDITRLAADGIVNAANSQMLGCWVPGHHCIDNAIHTFAGIQLRLECAQLMDTQGHEEPTAQAKVTDAYNLPARFVIHTVGPIAQGTPTPQMRAQLALCYRNCLNAAQDALLSSLAFCCISTGVFGFPQDQAAQIAISTAKTWLDEHPESHLRIVFNVFLDSDEKLYRSLLGFDNS